MTPDGYPDENELRAIREWPHQDGFAELLDYVIERWQYANVGHAKKEGDTVWLSTAGWSGNESLVRALKENRAFWMLCWKVHRRGGHYEFEINEVG